MVFQAPLRRFLLLLSTERLVNTPRTPLRHTEFLGSHSRCEGSKLERAAGDGRRGALEQYEVAAREFQKGLWNARLWRKRRPQSPQGAARRCFGMHRSSPQNLRHSRVPWVLIMVMYIGKRP